MRSCTKDQPIHRESKRVIYRYNRISQLLEKCFLFIFSLVDVQEVNQKFDRSALFGEILMLGKWCCKE